MSEQDKVNRMMDSINSGLGRIWGEPPVRSSEIVVPPPDCCAEWTRSGAALEPIAMATEWISVKLERMRFKFCPWCGRARHNNAISTSHEIKPQV